MAAANADLRGGAIGVLIGGMQFFGLPGDCLAILAALAVLPPLRGTTRVRQFLERDEVRPADRRAMYRSTIIFQWLIAAITAWRCHAWGWTAAELGLTVGKPLATAIAATVLALLLALLQVGALRAFAQNPKARRGVGYQMLRRLMPQSLAELPFFAVVLVTVSLCEEFLYRGFALAAFERVFPGSVAAAILAAALLFAIGHLYQGRQGTLNTFSLAVVFGIVRVWTGSLLPSVFSHFVTDSIAGIAGPRVVAAAATQENPQDEAAAEAVKRGERR